ncbi:MAG: hypothetical protein P0Y55_06940 [Candidatus Cohnella colombiensis]|uniref:Uncharacterized protein n=1 Tax=Candidatus Cohnella colombiensis TaxID=3121368 RepID=A0AA95EZL2_9BACL|nr:MAG: hypothetical protein P0Y55_06940 [Cohnella sp.]
MKINIIKTNMSFSKETGYVGHVEFGVEGHKQPYEITLQSDKGKNDWNYALNFSQTPGSEEEIQKVDEYIEEDDDLFDELVEAAMKTIEQQ